MQTTLAETLKTIAEHAPKLRAAGVHSLSVDGVSMILTAADQVATPAAALDEEEKPRGLLNDPRAYGREEGDPVPGFTRPDDL